jgi:hypothetical protein
VYSHFYAGKAVANFFTPASQKEPETMTWRVLNNSLLVGRYKLEISSLGSETIPPKRRKIAAFDFVKSSPSHYHYPRHIDSSTGLYTYTNFLRQRFWKRCYGLAMVAYQCSQRVEEALW